MNIFDYLDAFTLEYFSDVLQTARRINPVYDEAAKERRAQSSIELEDSPGFMPYMEAYVYAAGMEDRILYLQGYRDCISLLQFLSILPSESKSVFSIW